MVIRGLNLGMIEEVPEGAEVFLETGGQSLCVVVVQSEGDELTTPILELAPQTRMRHAFPISDEDFFGQGEARLAKGSLRPIALSEGLEIAFEVLPAELPVGSWQEVVAAIAICMADAVVAARDQILGHLHRTPPAQRDESLVFREDAPGVASLARESPGGFIGKDRGLPSQCLLEPIADGLASLAHAPCDGRDSA
jgi:hypothetical protein